MESGRGEEGGDRETLRMRRGSWMTDPSHSSADEQPPGVQSVSKVCKALSWEG
jgi:hypothetical protein